ncbi:MAG: aminotransferase DegT [Deltaproteobacteria bacterium GWC2_55_46]|nr:MAG: aminotransferase DegT [Deltaproteobacteria bacterium GWA2_55_82]OGQ64539.1 MAG: aminotransferase DegT [Deltaproteobacteria bacterium RIFCSPLOWO2_02_FULL_55_12]OIJ75055.1 MAG: aminotransferase DegT [Deltaproteobacteria bacterium GWC2_55_46]
MIPVCEPTLRGNELKYLKECVETNWISSTGRKIIQFEEAFARAVGAKYGVSCTNGTTALQLALYVAGVGPGDEVIIPTFTMIATANVVTHLGAKPVLVDSDPYTYTMDVGKIEEKITKKTKAIVPVDIYGHPCEMDAVLDIAERHGLAVIEDAAEAHGAEYRGRKIGSISDASTFSFYANKIITTGEGGMITTDSKEFYDKARNIRDHAFSEERHFWHKYVGFNFRMTNLQAAIGLAQVERFDELVGARVRNAQAYNSLLKDVPGLTLPPQAQGVKNVFWMYAIMVEDAFGMNRDELRGRLAERGIETRTFFIPMHLQPIYHKQYMGQSYPVSESLCSKGLYLPSSSSLSEYDIRQVSEAVIDIQARR